MLEAGTKTPTVAYPNESLHDAVATLVRNDVGPLPVVDPHNGKQPVGYLERSAIMAAGRHRLKQEHEPDRMGGTLLLTIETKPAGEDPGWLGQETPDQRCS